MYEIILILLGICIGYFLKHISTSNTPKQQRYTSSRPLTHQQKLLMKSYHQTDSDRIRELNLLSSNESVFLRLLKQTFYDFDIAIKHKRFIVLDRDKLPCAIFEYRDGTKAIKLVDEEDGLPLHLYKGLLSSDELKKDYQAVQQRFK